MPIYQYECKSCSHQLEEFQKVDDPVLEKCPSCNKKKLIRVITGGLGFFCSNRTLGIIADKNNDQFSDDFKNHLSEKTKTVKTDTLSKKLGQGASIMEKPKKEKPWYKKSQTVSDKTLKEATPNQLSNYIATGKLND